MDGQYSPFPFSDVYLNVGNGWNESTNTFVVPYPGVYHLHLLAICQPNTTVDYILMWNDIPYANVFFNGKPYAGPISRSKSVMIEASIGDTFNIATSSVSGLYGNSNRQTLFAGYLIFT